MLEAKRLVDPIELFPILDSTSLLDWVAEGTGVAVFDDVISVFVLEICVAGVDTLLRLVVLLLGVAGLL
tara:strand:+ start:174 stop:380 length:207 start_codon:yes stop_codon:yes gene_type:complete